MIRAIEGPNVATSVSMDYDIQETVAMTLFPALADWEFLKSISAIWLDSHNESDVMRAATEISPSLRYYLLLEYCKHKGNNVPAGIKLHIDAVNKEIKDVIRFPKVAKGISNGVKK